MKDFAKVLLLLVVALMLGAHAWREVRCHQSADPNSFACFEARGVIVKTNTSVSFRLGNDGSI